MHERGIAAFLPDGDGETVPSTVDGMLYPIHPLQVDGDGDGRVGQPATSRTSPRRARRRSAGSSWSSRRRCASRAAPARRSTRSRCSEMQRLEGRVAVSPAPRAASASASPRCSRRRGRRSSWSISTRRAGERAAEALRAAGHDALAVAADVVDRAAVDAMAAAALERYGRIDIVGRERRHLSGGRDRRDGRRRLGPGHGHQREGRAAHDPGVPAGHARARLRPHRADVVDHRPASSARPSWRTTRRRRRRSSG